MFFANAFDQGCDLRKAAVVGFVGVVIDWINVAVQIRGAENRDLHSLRRKAVAHKDQREQHHKRREGIDEW